MDKHSLLIVDDTPENLEVLYQILKQDYEIHAATRGQEALAIAGSHPFDLVLLDIMMPDMNGFEVCRRLKELPALQAVPILFLSALSEETNELAGFQAGAVDYITKPFKPQVVKQRVATHLALRAQTLLLQKRNEELCQALEKIKVLSGLLPICMICKKIRDDKGYWNQLETFISEHSETIFSHGYCPECAAKALNDMGKKTSD